MRLYLHDYGGHAFIVQLARALAKRGHTVRYGFSATNEAPQGDLAPRPDDPETFELDPVVTAPVDKRARSLTGLIKRRQAETRFGLEAAKHVRRWDPDVVVAANASLDVVAPLQRAAADLEAAFVNWLQDVLSVGTRSVLEARFGAAGDLLGRVFEVREGRLLRKSDAVIAITDDFRPLLQTWRVPDDRVTVLENWAPLDDLPQRPRDNAWARAHGLEDQTVVLYSGTLGMKHDPAGLAHLAEQLSHLEGARLVVVSSGEGADWLAREKQSRGLEALTLLPFQPFEVFPDVLGSADVVVAVLEPEASAVSVPSKVLAYLCAGRAGVLSVPAENLAAQIVTRAEAGLVVPPGDADALCHAVVSLLEDEERRTRMGDAGRAYAERAFDLEAIAGRFEDVLSKAIARRR